MTTARASTGKPLHFPGSFITNAVDVIVPPNAEELARIAGQLAPKALPLFVAGLMKSARRRRYQPRWSEMNRARLILARLCLDRMLAEGLDVPDAEGAADVE